MKYVESRDLFGNGPTKEIPMSRAEGAPNAATEGDVGCLYMDKSTGAVYKCTAVSENGEYTWVALIDKAEIQSIVDAYNAENPPKNGIDGEDGGHYTPAVTQPTATTMKVEFTPSKSGMPAVEPVTVTLPESNDSGENADLSAILETVPDNNLLDTSALVTQFVNADGATVTGNFSNYIPVKAGYRYVTNISMTQFHWFDGEKRHLSTATYINNPQVLNPAQSGYLLIKLPSDYSTSLVLEGTDIGAYRPAYQRLKAAFAHNPLRGKRLLVVADSIGTDTGAYASTGYGKLISRDLEMTLHNVSVSGKTAAWGYEVLDNCAAEFDIVTVMLGTNDQGYACPIGSLNDDYYTAGDYASSGSFYARMQLLVEKLRTKYPRSLILCMTPIKRTATGDSPSNDEMGYMTNALGLTTEAYRDAVIDVCNYYSIPCVDLYNAIDPRTEANRELYFMSATDGTHPNDLGHALMLAPVIKAAILAHTPYVFPEWGDSGDSGGGGEETATYTVTNTLTNVVNSNTAASVTAGANYTATLTAAEGYVLGAVTVTMGGVDITSTAYAGGNITIGAVAGNVVITATATAEESGGDSAEAVLVHAYSGTPDADGVLVDEVGDFDLGPDSFCRTRVDGVMGIVTGDSISIVVKNLTRKSNYHIEAFGFHTGAPGGMHVQVGGDTTYAGRFSIGLKQAPTAQSTFGNEVVGVSYYGADPASTSDKSTIEGGQEIANGGTVSFAMTYDATTNALRLYQDGELASETVTDIDLRVDGFCISGLGTNDVERIEVYKGVITV